MLQVLMVVLLLAASGCASSPRKIEIDNQLGSNSTLWMDEIFNGFPLVSFHLTARWDAPPGASVRKLEACLPAHVSGGTGLELTADNADSFAGGALRYRIQLMPRPEAGALPQDKHARVPGVIYVEHQPSPDLDASIKEEVAEFAAGVAEAGSRKKLGCWGANIFSAMDSAKKR